MTGKKIKIRVKRPWVGYPGSFCQNTYAEQLKHYWFYWQFKLKNDFTVEEKELPNPKPFITIDWRGSIDDTLTEILTLTEGSRVRIRSDQKIPLTYSSRIVSSLRNDIKASEIVFKEGHEGIDPSMIVVGNSKYTKTDLRNPEVLLSLLKDNYNASEVIDEEWGAIGGILRDYISKLALADDPRHVEWSLRKMKFSNVFSYGENNTLNFDKLTGLVGLFGPNRAGKSSVLGTLMYALFNSTDRGSIKNAYICNSRKQSCNANVVISVNGKDYLIKRTTTKRDDDETSASTNLRVWQLVDGKPVESTGEQRNDTERVLRGLIGNFDDFCLMSLSTQRDGSNSLLDHGNTKRRQILSRFFDIDILQRLHELAKDDIKQKITTIKSSMETDWSQLIDAKQIELDDVNVSFDRNVEDVERSRNELSTLRIELSGFDGMKVVTRNELDAMQVALTNLEAKLISLKLKKSRFELTIKEHDTKIERLQKLLETHDISALKQQLRSFNELRELVERTQAEFKTEGNKLEASNRTLLILDDVPCKGSFPTCKFIKNAHDVKPEIPILEQRVQELREKYDALSKSLKEFDHKKLNETIDKVEKLKDKCTSMRIERSKFDIEIMTVNNDETLTISSIEATKNRFEEARGHVVDSIGAQVVALRERVSKLENDVGTLEHEGTRLATLKGRLASQLEVLVESKIRLDDVLQDLKVYEIIERGMSKTGIQDVVLASLLPVINGEISGILKGIVDFTLELDKKPDSDQIDIYINDGERRLLELSSGMERFISTIVLRLALHNVSSLPKSDIFIIDEGFGSLDATSSEECNSLLRALKRYFKTILIITHQETIKDVVDTVIEVSKIDRDSRLDVQ